MTQEYLYVDGGCTELHVVASQYAVNGVFWVKFDENQVVMYLLSY